jgi:hypothetical protein
MVAPTVLMPLLPRRPHGGAPGTALGPAGAGGVFYA